MKTAVVLIVALAAGQSQPLSVRAGVMVASPPNRVLAMDGPVLPAGTPLTVVSVEDPQEVWHAVIVKPLADSEVMARHNTAGPYYQVAAERGSKPLPDFGVAIVGRPGVRRLGAAVALTFANPRRQIRVRGCTSSEGVHLTLWAGEALRSERLWHKYYYLGYDVEPTCQTGDIGSAADNALHPSTAGRHAAQPRAGASRSPSNR